MNRRDTARAALLAEEQVQAAAALRRLEAQTGQDTQQLAALQAQQAAATQKLAGAQAMLEKLLPIMQRLSNQPAATMLASPLSPPDAVRGVAIMQGVAQAIATQAEAVKTQTDQLAVLVAQAQDTKNQLDAAVAVQQNAENALTNQIGAAKSTEMADADTAASAAAASAATQTKLTSITAAVTPAAPAATPVNLPAGNGGIPVAGRIIQAFGADTLAGPATGVSFSTAPGARVVTPCAGTVLWARPVPSYGLVVIADCGSGTSVVLAGMNNLDVAAGQHLAHGQPVGTMLGFDPTNPTRQPVLYVELRENNTPVDPTAWLAGGSSG